MGTELPHVKARIVDDDGRECEHGTAGELRVKGGTLFEMCVMSSK